MLVVAVANLTVCWHERPSSAPRAHRPRSVTVVRRNLFRNPSACSARVALGEAEPSSLSRETPGRSQTQVTPGRFCIRSDPWQVPEPRDEAHSS